MTIFAFILAPALADTCGLVLELDDLELKFRDTTGTGEEIGGYAYVWVPSSLGWTDNQSVEVKLVVSDGSPCAPTGLTAMAHNGRVALAWTAGGSGDSAITKHQVCHKEVSTLFLCAATDWADILDSTPPDGANATSYTVPSLENGTEYAFRVRAVNEDGGGIASNDATATPMDTTAPVLMSATTTALELKLFYDENLDAGSEPAPSAFTVAVNGASRAVTGVALDETKVTLTLASAVRAGDLVTVSYTVPAMNPLRDEARNPAAVFSDHPVTNEVPATVPDAPSSLAATPGDESVTLRWTASAYDGGSEVTSHQYRRKTTGGFGSWEDIELSAPGEANATSYPVASLANATSYTFEVQARNEEGESGPSNQASATPVAGDTTAPMLRSATTTALEVGLTYDENLDAGSEPAPSAFSVTVDGASRVLTGVALGGTKVLLTLASAVRAGDLVRVSYTVPAMNPLRDEANNPAAAFSDHSVTNEVPATAPEAPTGLAATPGDGSVTLRWTASAHDGGSEVTGHQYRHKTTGGFGSWEDIELSAPGEANAASYPVTSLANDTAYTFEVQARNAEGESGPSNQASATPVAGDSTAPMLRSATTTALELALTYDEDLDADSEPAPSAFTVAVNGASRAVTGVSVGAKVLLTLAPAVRAGETVTVSYTVPAMNPLRDEARNPAIAFSDHPVTNEVPATAPDAPSNLAATPGDGSVTLRWTASAHDGGSEVTGHQYRRKTTGDFGSWEDIADSAEGEANATSYPVTSLMNDTAYTFEVQARNEEGESGPSNQARATPVPGDSTAPMLRSATTTALALGLTYDENLDGGSEPAPSAFTVTVDGAFRAVTGVSVGDTKVLLTLAPAVRAVDLVRVSYTVPAMNPLRDEARNPAASFADHPVTNEVPATVPDAPASLAATPGDGSVTLRWTASAHDGGSEVTGHQYRRKTTGDFGSWEDIADSAPGEANATSYPVTSLMNDTAYTFEVQARNAEGESGPSNQASATPVPGDSTAPVLQSATTTALEVGLTYDENLDADSEPAPSAFTVTVNGASRAVTGVALGDTKVLLTLAPAVRAGEPVTVSYTVPANDPAPGRGEQPRRRLCRPPGDERDPGDGAGRPVEPRGDPRRRFGDPAVDGVRPRRRARGHGPPVLPQGGDGRLVHRRWRLAGHRGQRAGRGERDRLHGGEPDERHRVHLPGAGAERGGRERSVHRGGHHPGRRRHLTGARAGGERGVRTDGREPGAASRERASGRRRRLAGDGGRRALRGGGGGGARAP